MQHHKDTTVKMCLNPQVSLKLPIYSKF
jgi:hypothetical protein